MSKKISLKRQPTPISLLDWISLYDTAVRRNYALEFLTAATYDTIAIPDARRYQLPPDVEDRDLDETVTESQKEDIIERWEQGSRPWAIKCLDKLRELENPEFRLDLLRPRLYDGTESRSNNIPFAVDILPGLVYLYMSVFISGCSSEASQYASRGSAAVYPKRLSKKQLKTKLKGVYTENRKCEGVGLKQPFGNLLQLIGMPQGEIIKLDYEELGLGFIEKLVSWVEKKRLSKRDNEHAMNALYRSMEAFMDLRYGVYTSCTHRRGREYFEEKAVIYTPSFRKKKTSNQFLEFFLNVWNLVNPDIPMKVYPGKIKGNMPKNPKRRYYYTCYPQMEHTEELEARFSA